MTPLAAASVRSVVGLPLFVPSRSGKPMGPSPVFLLPVRLGLVCCFRLTLFPLTVPAMVFLPDRHSPMFFSGTCLEVEPFRLPAAPAFFLLRGIFLCSPFVGLSLLLPASASLPSLYLCLEFYGVRLFENSRFALSFILRFLLLCFLFFASNVLFCSPWSQAGLCFFFFPTLLSC